MNPRSVRCGVKPQNRPGIWFHDRAEEKPEITDYFPEKYGMILGFQKNRDAIRRYFTGCFIPYFFMNGYDVMICTVRTHKRFSIQGNDFIVRKRNL